MIEIVSMIEEDHTYQRLQLVKMQIYSKGEVLNSECWRFPTLGKQLAGEVFSQSQYTATATAAEKEGQGPTQVGSRTWECHSHDTGFAGVKDSRVRGHIESWFQRTIVAMQSDMAGLPTRRSWESTVWSSGGKTQVEMQSSGCLGCQSNEVSIEESWRLHTWMKREALCL